MQSNNELCEYLTTAQCEENPNFEQWMDELAAEVAEIEKEFEMNEEFELDEDEMAPGMLEAYPELWARIQEVMGSDAEEDTLS